MRNFKFCHDSILKGQSITSAEDHVSCYNKADTLYNSNVCVRCGKNKRYNEFSDRCSDCEVNRLDYQGYEGPGQ